MTNLQHMQYERVCNATDNLGFQCNQIPLTWGAVKVFQIKFDS